MKERIFRFDLYVNDVLSSIELGCFESKRELRAYRNGLLDGIWFIDERIKATCLVYDVTNNEEVLMIL